MSFKFWPAIALALSLGVAQAQTTPAKPAPMPVADKASPYPAVPAGAERGN